jgi:RND family efflux transporter MFP subunit
MAVATPAPMDQDLREQTEPEPTAEREGLAAASETTAPPGGATGQAPRVRWKRYLLLVVPLVFVGIPLARFMLSPKTPQAAERATPVVVGTPVRGTLDVLLRYSGNLKPQSTTTVVPKVAGRVDAIHVLEGQAVREGQVVAEMEDDVVRLQADQARAAWDAAQAQLEKAQRGARPEEVENARATLVQAEKDLEAAQANFERTRSLYQAGTVTRSRFEEAENAIKAGQTQLDNARRTVRILEQGARAEDLAMARANANAARSQYELALLQVEYTKVKAPITGTVARLLVERGNMVGPGTPLLAIVNGTLTYANVAVPEKHYERVSRPDAAITARIFPIAYPDRAPFPGTVTNVGSTIDPASRTFTVEIAIHNADGLLRPGMYVNAEMVLERRQDVLLVPSSAVLFRNERYVVFVLREADGPAAVAMRDVQIGAVQDERTEIVTGLAQGERIVTAGNTFLEDGQTVDIVRQP